MRWLATSLGLALVYLATVGAWTLADTGVALAVGGAAGHAALRGNARASARWLLRRLLLPWLALGVAAEVARGGWQMLLVLLRQEASRAGEVEVPFGPRSRRGAEVAGWITSATPGSVLVDVDVEREVLVLHVIDASDPAAVRQQLDAFHRRFQRHVVP